jgi:hypothetical protein
MYACFCAKQDMPSWETLWRENGMGYVHMEFAVQVCDEII